MLSEKIKKLIADEGCRTDDIGMSGASVLLYDTKVLKIQEPGEEEENEYRILKYLRGKLPVPKVHAYEHTDGMSYLLMDRCEGEMACAESYMIHPELLCKLLANGLKKLWSIDISACPSDQRLSYKLARAQYNIEHGLVDLDNVEPETFGENGFKGPEELLAWLWEHRPEEELVFSHGDFCLPNLFGVGTEVTGYIDLGRAGIADKWCDIALCYRSLSHNCNGKYRNSKAYTEYDSMLLNPYSKLRRKAHSLPNPQSGFAISACRNLFRELGIAPDWEKIRYYILLDELF